MASDPELRRLLGWNNAPSATLSFVYDGDLRGYFGPGNTVQHTTNSLGFRGEEFAEEKSPDALRIAILGDSFTFGEGVRDEDTYSEQLRRKLAEALPGRRIETQNWGVGGYNTEQEAALLEHWVLDFDPDVVVLGFTINDAEPRLFFWDRRTGSLHRRWAGMEMLTEPRDPDPSDWKRLRVLRLFAYFLHDRDRSRKAVAYHRRLYSDESEDWARCRTALARIAATCRERDLHCYVLAFPLLWQLSDYPLADVHHKTIAAIAEAGLEPIDLLPALRRFESWELWVHPTDQHPNEVAHEVAAEILSKRLLRDSALGLRAPSPRP